MHCFHCNSANVIKNGRKTRKSKKKIQNFLCKSCKKQFLYDYTYTGCHPSKRKSVVEHLLRSCGIRDVKALEKVSYDFIYKTLRSSSSFSWEPRLDTYASVLIDELYLIVKKKRKEKKLYITYAYAEETGEILAFTVGRRDTQQARNILLKIKCLQIKVTMFYTDNWRSFTKALKEYKHPHTIGKEYTTAIEGFNTFLRTRLKRLNRRTTAFSKLVTPVMQLLHLLSWARNTQQKFVK